MGWQSLKLYSTGLLLSVRKIRTKLHTWEEASPCLWESLGRLGLKPGSAFNELGQWTCPFCSQGLGLLTGSQGGDLPSLLCQCMGLSVSFLGSCWWGVEARSSWFKPGSQIMRPCSIWERSQGPPAPILHWENLGSQPGWEPHAVAAEPSSLLLAFLSSALFPQILSWISAQGNWAQDVKNDFIRKAHLLSQLSL